MALELFALPPELLREITLYVLSGAPMGGRWKERTTGWRAACKRSHELVGAILALQHVDFAGVVGYQAFVAYTALNSVTLRGTQLHTIAGHAFYHVTTLRKVVLPPTLRVIGQCAFCGCSSLTDIVLPDGLQQIQDSAFLKSGLTSITLPSSIVHIATRAFGMSRLERIEFKKPSSLFQLDDYAFHANATLNGTVELPASLQQIGYDVFKNCHCETIRVPTTLARSFNMDQALHSWSATATVVRY